MRMKWLTRTKERYIPLGYSRKFWYLDVLSTSISSITSPSQAKKIFIDPNSLPLLKGKKLFIIDDAVSSGTTLKRAWELLASEEVGCEVLGAGVVMKQVNPMDCVCVKLLIVLG